MEKKDTLKLALEGLDKLKDDELAAIALRFTMPWQTIETSAEEEGTETGKGALGVAFKREDLQQACWAKFNENPQVGTSVSGKSGRLTGFGFEISSEIPDIQDVIEEIELDQRNRLYTFWPKFVSRSIIEGELFLCCTVHNDGFIEIDFIDPSNITGGGDDGIIYHPRKSTMPLFYYVKQESTNNSSVSNSTDLVPSIFIARYPELVADAKKVTNFQEELTNTSKSNNRKFKKVGGYKRFIISWDKGFITKRNVSYLRTILEWLNHYENLKKYEIDHKKSAGAYLWVVTIEDPKAFRTWLSLTDAERKKTGLMAKKTPGGTLILPPGMKLECKNPSLPSITEQDTDIFHMITAGLNEPEDVTSGQSKGTFASVKASRGPMADRIADEISAFEKFLRYDFWGNLFFLKSVVVSFPSLFTQKVAVDFKDQEPIFRNIKKKPEYFLSISFPTSEVSDTEGVARALLGVKHGSTFETLGIPNAEIARKMGFNNYRRLRLQQETEKANYPELMLSVDQASIPGQGTNQDAATVKKPALVKRVKKD
jgi:hypothetical protein